MHLLGMCALISRIRPLDIIFRVFNAGNIHVLLFWVVKPENTNLVLNNFKLSITVHSAIRKDIKTKNAHKNIKVYYIHRIPPTCFGQSCGHLQGGALQSIHKSKYCRYFEPTHGHKILKF